MTLLDQIQIDPLLEVYLFANTPMYLYQHFRKNNILRHLVDKNIVDDMVSEYNTRVNQDKRRIEDIIIAYAILVALTFLEYEYVLEAFKKMELSKLEWGHEIKDIFVFYTTPVSTVTINVAQPTVHVVSRPSSNGNFTVLAKKSELDISVREN